MITELRIQGFKPWPDTGALRFAPITAFFGANSSGKTSLLQFLLMLKQTVESADRRQVLDLGGGPRAYVDLGTFEDVLHRAGDPAAAAQRLEWHLRWKLPKLLRIVPDTAQPSSSRSGEELLFQAELTRGDDGAPLLHRLGYKFADQHFELESKENGKGRDYELRSSGSWEYQPRRARGRPSNLGEPIKCYGFPDPVRTAYQNTAFLADFELALETLFTDLRYLGPLRDHPKRQYPWGGGDPADMGRRGENTVAALLAAGRSGRTITATKTSPKPHNRRHSLEERVAGWLRDLDLIHSFTVKELSADTKLYRVEVRKSPSSAPVLLTDVGFGVSQLLPVLTLCFYAPEGSTVILEQPELHLHPAVQAGLADMLIDAVRSRKIQLVVESHSEFLLQRLQRRIAEKVIAKDDLAVYFCERDDGASRCHELELDLFGRIRNWPADFFGDAMADLVAREEAAHRRSDQEAA